MATPATTSSTNLDVSSIVTQLMTVERQPITKLNTKEASYQAKLSAFGSVKGALASFQTAVQGLNSTAKFQALKASSSDATIFSASAASIAVAGTYSLEVTNLAQSQKLIAAGRTSSTDPIGDPEATTTLTFDFGTITGTLTPYDGTPGTGTYEGGASFQGNGGDSYSVTIDSSNNSLQGIRDAINARKMGVTATIVNDGSNTPYRLSLSSDSLGAANSLKISVSGDSEIGDLLGHDPEGTQNLAETVTAKNANLKVNGVAVSKASNSVSDVVQGVTINLLKETATPATLTVARDTATIGTSIGSFVKAYNDLASTLKAVSAYDPATKKGAVLQGDSTVRALQSQLRNMLSAAAGDASSTLRTLSDVGVAFQLDGSLAVKQEKLDSALTSNFSEIAALFTSDNGYIPKLNTWTTSMLASDGILASRADGIGKTITDIGNRRSAMEARLLVVEKRYRAQFTSLDSMLSSMNLTSTYLTQQLSSLGGK